MSHHSPHHSTPIGCTANYFYRAYANNLKGPYLVWTEVAGGGGAQNFITGAGGFAQTVWAGETALTLNLCWQRRLS